MRPIGWLAALALLLVPAVAPAAAQATTSNDVIAIELVPADGTEFVLGDRTYGGEMSIGWHRNGLSVVEEVTLDGYLAGVREVPLSWPEGTLKAQAVAARSYLAWTLERGRSQDGETYDFDICATTQCQVYAGTGVVRDPDGSRWLAAISETSREILLYEGGAAQTLYSSSAGSRTRAVQDIWEGNATPYLQPVDSPEAGVTPYEAWDISLEVEALRRIFARAGISIGSDIRAMRVERPSEGQGASDLVIESDLGTVAIPATTVRTRVNQYGPVLYPGLLPAGRPDGRKWPQAFLSYTFDVRFTPGVPIVPTAPLPTEDLPSTGSVSFQGEGWGHGVGMSQWGAYAMGEQGSDYVEILSHYYGGLKPTDGGGSIPEVVRVGLAWARSQITVTATGPFRLRVNGLDAGEYGGGPWSFRSLDGGIVLVPPPELVSVARLVGSRPWPR